MYNQYNIILNLLNYLQLLYIKLSLVCCCDQSSEGLNEGVVVPFVNGLCYPKRSNIFGFPKCTLRTLTSSSCINQKQLKIFHLISFVDFKFNDGLSGSPNSNQNPYLTVPVAGFLPRLHSNLTTGRFSLLL